MTAERIAKILEQHGTPFYEQNGRIYADSMLSGTKLFEEIIDVTEWTRSELLRWLGY
jgi:hypothetical protein